MRKTDEILEIMQIFAKENPQPQCELNFHNPYTLLVAVMLSAQSTDKGVNKATEALFKVADTPYKMLNLGLENLKGYIKTTGKDGYYNMPSFGKSLGYHFGVGYPF